MDAEEFSDWMPPDGEYVVSVIKSSKGAKANRDSSKAAMLWWKLTGRIEAGENVAELLGKEFAVGFYNTEAPGILKGQARALNGGEALATLPEAAAVVQAALGLILRVQVKTTTSTKTGKEYTNCYIQEVLDTTSGEEGGASSEPPQGDAMETSMDAGAAAPV